ncbi:metal ABC transporter solute-binding protein, Zn/Mn family [Aerococcaceae bacterium WGS1372]
MKVNFLRSHFLKIITAVLMIMQVSPLPFSTVQAKDKIEVVTSFYPVYEFAREVGGDRIDLTLMVDQGKGPHGYEPSAQDVVEVNDADVFIYSSDAMEAWAKSLLNNIDNEDLVVVQASGDEPAGHHHESHDDHSDHEEDMEHEDHNHGDDSAEETEASQVNIIGLADHYHSHDVVQLKAELQLDQEVSNWQWQVRQDGSDWEIIETATTDSFEYELDDASLEIQVQGLDSNGQILVESDIVEAHIDNHDELDPHSWLDPVLAQEQVDRIRDAFIQVDPEGEAEYTANAQAFKEALQQLDADYQNAFEGAKNRQFIVQHEAFGYLAQRYQLEQVSVGGLSTEVEPSPQRMGEILTIIKDTGASVIYYQSGANSAIAQTIAQETGAEIVELFDLEIAPSGQELTYLEAMYQNLEALKLSIH